MNVSNVFTKIIIIVLSIAKSKTKYPSIADDSEATIIFPRKRILCGHYKVM